MIYMEQFKDGNSFEQRKEELRRLIAQKKEFAVYDDQYDELFDSVEQYEGLIKEGISLTDYEQEDYETKKEQLDSFSIKVSTLPELRFILEEIGQSEEQIQRNLAHENAHSNVATSLGANHESYIVYFLKNGNIYQTRITFPHHLTPVDVDEISRRAISAPEEYGEGGGLSDDEKQLKYYGN